MHLRLQSHHLPPFNAPPPPVPRGAQPIHTQASEGGGSAAGTDAGGAAKGQGGASSELKHTGCTAARARIKAWFRSGPVRFTRLHLHRQPHTDELILHFGRDLSHPLTKLTENNNMFTCVCVCV